VLVEVRNGRDSRQKLLEVFPRGTLDHALKTLLDNGYVQKSLKDKEIMLTITTKGFEAIRSSKDFSKVKITRTPQELLETFKAELTNQVILLDKTLQDMIATVPFCSGRIGRQFAAVTAYFVSTSGRGKSVIMDIYKDLFENPAYLDCKDLWSDRGIENKFKRIASGNPDIAIFEEVSQLYGSKLTSLQSNLNNHVYPVVFTANPSSQKTNYKNDTFHGWLHSVYLTGKHASRSFIDRINLFIYLPKLQPRKERELIDIFFDENVIDLSEVGAYVKAQKGKNPKPSPDAQKQFIEIRDKVKDYVEHNPTLTLPKQPYQDVIQQIDLTDFTGGENMARFEISLMILARGMAIRDDSREITPDYFETAFDWYFYFLGQIYRIKMRREVGL